MNHFFAAMTGAAMMIGAAISAATPDETLPPDPGAESINPMVAGSAMLPTRNIVDNLASSPEHAKLLSALMQSGLDGTLRGKGPFTIFAPTDNAFAAAGAIGGKAALGKLLDYHVVRGRLDSKTLLQMIGEGGGSARLKTLEGGTLTATLNGPTNIVLVDAKGRVADIVIYDIYESNGVMQVIDRVETPG